MKLFKRIMLTIIAIVILIGGSVFVFFKTAPQIGGNPSGERLERMKQATNFKEGKFENTIETNMDMPFGKILSVMNKMLFGDKTGREPIETIKTQLFNRNDFEGIGADTIAVSWMGHSSILIKIDGVTILTDPVMVGDRASMFSFIGPKRFKYDHYMTIEELPEVDLVIMSHDHYDHLDYPTINALKDKVQHFYMPLGMGAHFEKWGVPAENISEFNWWDEVEFQGLQLALTPTRHFSGRGMSNRFSTLWGSWVIMGKTQRIYFSGDSGYFPGFKEIGNKYGPFDLTFMECGAYNEDWSEIHMFPEETAQAHLDVKGGLLMPIHWGKFDLSLHTWKESVNRLTKKAEEENIQLFTPEIGETVFVPCSEELGAWWERYE
jgi:L-ascorbate metabolism protein UlaG (beta-lactamase superfamily)